MTTINREFTEEALAPIFLKQKQADYISLEQNPGDGSFLSGLEASLLRVASDFFWADYITSYLTYTGILSKY